MRRTQRKRIVGLVWIVLLAAPAAGDGFVVPVEEARPESRPIPFRGSWAVKYHHVDIRVRDQVASVSIDQAFVNTSKRAMEVEYYFPVPPHAAIDAMTLRVDGKEYAARLLEADKAREIYENTVRRLKDPALLEYAGAGLYKTSAFPLEPGKPVKVLVTYKDVCDKDRDRVEVWYPLNTEKFSSRPIESVKVAVDIMSAADITAVYSPTHDLDVTRQGPRHVLARYAATKTLPVTDFQVFYKAANEAVGATLISHQPVADEDGYFLLLVGPNPRDEGKPVAKDLAVVLDHSGSMRTDDKITQAKRAATRVIRNLNVDDRFCVLAYNDSVTPLTDGLVPAEAGAIATATDKIDAVDASGATDIHAALQAAMGALGDDGDGRPAYVLFLTDGKPTVGKTNEKDILAATHKANARGARLFAFGVGYKPNVRLLDTLAAGNGGRSDYARPSEPIDEKVTSLYNKIKNPVMTDLAVEIDGVTLRQTYPRELGDLFDGDQILMAGRYDAEDARKLPTRERGVMATQLVVTGMYRGKRRGFEYGVTLRAAGRDIRYAFVEKLWAARRIGYLLDQIQLHGKSEEVVDEIVRLSMAHGIMTPYTSFLADEGTELSRRDELRTRGLRATESLTEETTGRAGQMHATNRQKLNQADRVAPSEAPAATGEPGGAPAGTMIGHSDGEAYEDAAEAEEKSAKRAEGVRQYAEQAAYRRGKLWVVANAAHLDPDEDAEKIEDVERYSDDYFELVRENSAAENQILADQRDDEELLIVLRGQAYRIR
ncbi:MAG: VWA domain-containing protein [Phycisphaerae bacterium]|nr:VWA domain-containing protein [Phycisphaerae bacterium]